MPQKNILISNARIAGSAKMLIDGWLLIDSGRIGAIGEGRAPANLNQHADVVINADGLYLLPGFIDLHTHGALGVDFMSAREAELQQVSEFFAAHGVTGFLATTWSASADSINQTIANIGAVMGRENGAALLGIHLEGPYINPARAGAQNPREIRAATQGEALSYLDSGLVRVITIAPEIKENHWLIEACKERNIRVSVGHSDATYAEVRSAVELGLTQVTHTFNGMRAFNQREPGVVGAALELDELCCEVIVDKVHVHPAVIRLLLRSKPERQVVLVTDSIAGTGLPPGVVEIQGRKICFTEYDARLPDRTLAGSVLTMDQAMRNLAEIMAKPVEALYAYASHNAARALGLESRKGSIREGMDADLVLLDDLLTVKMTIINGKIVYQQ